jgi:hypothetical protein
LNFDLTHISNDPFLLDLTYFVTSPSFSLSLSLSRFPFLSLLHTQREGERERERERERGPVFFHGSVMQSGIGWSNDRMKEDGNYELGHMFFVNNREERAEDIF